jgi:NAD(P)-dependent dehydrogenase (short-subunit alcohol dehydrogenase family)
MPRRVEGRAAIVLAREGARVLVADRHLEAARETTDMITAEGGLAWPVETDIPSQDDARRLVATALERFGRVDLLHDNVGASLALGDASATELTQEAFQRSFDVNLKGMWLICKHALPALRESAGSIVNISSMAARNADPLVGHKTTKAAPDGHGLGRRLRRALPAFRRGRLRHRRLARRRRRRGRQLGLVRTDRPSFPLT